MGGTCAYCGDTGAKPKKNISTLGTLRRGTAVGKTEARSIETYVIAAADVLGEEHTRGTEGKKGGFHRSVLPKVSWGRSPHQQRKRKSRN